MGVQATGVPSVGDQSQAVGFVDHQRAGSATGGAGHQAQGSHLGVEVAHKAVGADAQKRIGCHKVGSADIDSTAGIKREIGGAPIHIGRAAQDSLCRRVGHLDAVELVIESNAKVIVWCIVGQQHVAQHQVATTGQGRDHQAVKSLATRDAEVAATVIGIEIDDIATVAGVDLGVATTHNNGVALGAGGH